MGESKITLGEILAVLAIIIFLLWFIPLWINVIQDPVKLDAFRNFISNALGDSLSGPAQIGLSVVTIAIIVLLAGVLIAAVLKGWKYIMNYRI
jgi:small-conductance mechanosensitive channel